MNDWDFTEEILNDLYKTWPEMLYYTVLAFGKTVRFYLIQYLLLLNMSTFVLKYLLFALFTALTFLIILLIHLLTNIIAYVLLIAVSLMFLGR